MVDGAGTERAKVCKFVIGLGQFDVFGYSHCRQLCIDGQGEIGHRNQTDRNQITSWIKAESWVKGRHGGHTRRSDIKGVPVSGFQYSVNGQTSACARSIFNQDRLTKYGAEVVADLTDVNVRAGPCWSGYHQTNRFRGKTLCPCQQWN